MKYTLENNRDLIIDKDGILHLDESKLDIFDYYNEPIKQWEPPFKNEVKPYDKLKVFSLDIETTGGVIEGSDQIDAINHSIVLIGIKNHRGESLILDAKKNERQALIYLFKLFQITKPDILAVYNGFKFDLPFIIKRAQIHGLKHPFWVQTDKETGKPHKKIRNTAQVNSQAVVYTPIWLNIDNGYGTPRHHCAIVDLYHEILAWDFVKRKLTSYRLKEAPYQMGLIDGDEIIDLSYPEMLERIDRWNDGGKEELSAYLESDLNLTKVLGDDLIPPVYYQSIFLDWKLQSIISSGNGSKWNSLIENYYKNLSLATKTKFELPQSDEKRRFKGAYSAAYAGFYYDPGYEITEFDILSLYPHIVLLYGITSKKDTHKIFLSMLDYMLTNRIINKKQYNELEKLAESYILTLDQKSDMNKANNMQGTLKIFSNSGYGQLGTKGIAYNDYEGAALVTGYGRAIFRHIVRLVGKLPNVKFCSLDTDGFKVYHTTGKAQEILKYINDNLPGNNRYQIQVKIEWTAKAFFVPESKNQNGLNAELIEDGDMGLVRSGLKKNYIIIMKDVIKDDGTVVPGKLKFNGKYRKRDRSKLEKEFQPKFIQLLVNDSELAARKYYKQIRDSILNHTIDVKYLAVTRKIKKTEVNLIKNGIGVANQVVTIHRSNESHIFNSRTKEYLKNPKYVWTNDPSDVCWDAYVNILDEMFIEIHQYLMPKTIAA